MKIGLQFEEKKPSVKLERFEVEGGPAHADFKALVETPFQLKGMNAMGMPGHELHGIIGYTLLAHYKIEYDFTRDRLAWTRLDFKPPAPVPLGVKPDKDVQGLEALGGFMEAMGILMGKRPQPILTPRGFFGIQLEEKDGSVLVKGVLENAPGAAAGLRAGDRLTHVSGKQVASTADVLRRVADVPANLTLKLTIERAGEMLNVTITAGEGL
jgi:membrane-associated protease RseP (regulator of RpoE activity)